MNDSITLENAQKLLEKHVHEEYLLNHCLETEAVMRGLAEHFGENPDFWGITGLLHDLDMEQLNGELEKHGHLTCKLLQDEGYEMPEMFHAIKSHAECLGFENAVKRESKLEFCLSAGENITGLIYAYVMMRPDKKIEGLKAKSITKKLKDKSFAANVNREMINDIEKTGLSRAQFIEIAIESMKTIAEKVGI
ncbi:MAG: HD domain-containing protein [Candidatus Diapherotrites archaeon]|nr:HD domain-containing protein [Candidatus Diapherotrites archaeon]